MLLLVRLLLLLLGCWSRAHQVEGLAWSDGVQVGCYATRARAGHGLPRCHAAALRGGAGPRGHAHAQPRAWLHVAARLQGVPRARLHAPLLHGPRLHASWHGLHGRWGGLHAGMLVAWAWLQPIGLARLHPASSGPTVSACVEEVCAGGCGNLRRGGRRRSRTPRLSSVHQLHDPPGSRHAYVKARTPTPTPAPASPPHRLAYLTPGAAGPRCGCSRCEPPRKQSGTGVQGVSRIR